MAKKTGIGTSIVEVSKVRKKTSIGGNNSMISKAMMNKAKRRNYKKYRGQGKKQFTFASFDSNIIIL